MNKDVFHSDSYDLNAEILKHQKSLSSEITNLTKINQMLQVKFSNLACEIKERGVQVKINSLSKEFLDTNTSLHHINRISDYIFCTYEEIIYQIGNNISDLNEKIRRKNCIISKLKKNVKLKGITCDSQLKMFKNFEDIKEESAKKDEQLRQFKSKVKKLQCKLQKEVEKNSDLKINAPYSEHNRMLEETDQVNLLRTKVDCLEQELSHYKSTTENLLAQNQEKQVIIDKHSSVVCDLENQINSVRKENSKLKKNNHVTFHKNSFEINNPFEGELKERIDRIKQMDQIEPSHKIQLMLNEAVNEINALKSNCETLDRALGDAQKRAAISEKEAKEYRDIMKVYINELKDIESNEKLLDVINPMSADKKFLSYIKSVVSSEFISLDEVDAIINDFVNRDDPMSTLVSAITMTSRKLKDQFQKMAENIKEKDQIIESTETSCRSDKERLTNYINELEIERNKYKDISSKLQTDIDSIKNTLKVDNVNQAVEDLHNSLKELKSQNDALEVKNNELISKIKSLTNDITKAEGDSALKQQQINQLQSTLNEIRRMGRVSINGTTTAKQSPRNGDLSDSGINSSDGQTVSRRFRNHTYNDDLNGSRSDVFNGNTNCNGREYRSPSGGRSHSISNDVITSSAELKNASDLLRTEYEMALKKIRSIKDIDNDIFQRVTIKRSKKIETAEEMVQELKELLQNVIEKLRAVTIIKKDLEEEVENLRRGNLSLKNQVAFLQEDCIRREEKARNEAKREFIVSGDSDAVLSSENSVATIKERQRIIGLIIAELGEIYETDVSDLSDNNSLIKFFKRIHGDIVNYRGLKINSLNK